MFLKANPMVSNAIDANKKKSSGDKYKNMKAIAKATKTKI